VLLYIYISGLNCIGDWCIMKVLSSETIPSSVALVDPNLCNLVDEVAVKVTNVCKVES